MDIGDQREVPVHILYQVGSVLPFWSLNPWDQSCAPRLWSDRSDMVNPFASMSPTLAQAISLYSSRYDGTLFSIQPGHGVNLNTDPLLWYEQVHCYSYSWLMFTAESCSMVHEPANCLMGMEWCAAQLTHASSRLTSHSLQGLSSFLHYTVCVFPNNVVTK